MGNAAADLFNHPDALDAGVFGVNDAGIDEGAVQERFGLLGVDAVHDPAEIGIDGGPDHIHDIRVWGQDQDRFHSSVARTRR
jgi:hypothetical protein